MEWKTEIVSFLAKRSTNTDFFAHKDQGIITIIIIIIIIITKIYIAHMPDGKINRQT